MITNCLGIQKKIERNKEYIYSLEIPFAWWSLPTQENVEMFSLRELIRICDSGEFQVSEKTRLDGIAKEQCAEQQ
jgi:hypothetical protein